MLKNQQTAFASVRTAEHTGHPGFQKLTEPGGIFSAGYGILPKAVMLDTDLTPEAKAIYAYLCSYAGEKGQCFPGHKRILAELRMCSDAFYRHYHLLEEQGYLLVTRKAQPGHDRTAKHGFLPNSYQLTDFPIKYKLSEKIPDRDKPLYQQVCAAGLRSAGYGFIAKKVMQDPTLSVKAKALYSFYAAFAGIRFFAFPERDTVIYRMQMGEKALQRYTKELVSSEFLTVTQTVTNGRFSRNSYRLAGFEAIESTLSPAHEPKSENRIPTPTTETENRELHAAPPEKADKTICFPGGSDTPPPLRPKQELPKRELPVPETNKNRFANKKLKNKQYQKSKRPNWKGINGIYGHSDGSHTLSQKGNPAPVSYNTHARALFVLSNPGFSPKRYPQKIQDRLFYVADRLIQTHRCPTECRTDPLICEALTLLLCEDEFMGIPERYAFLQDDGRAMQLHRYTVSAMNSLLFGDTTVQIGGATLSTENIYRVIDANLRFSDGDGITLGGKIEQVKANYLRASKKSRIFDPVAYLRNSLWNALCEGCAAQAGQYSQGVEKG